MSVPMLSSCCCKKSTLWVSGALQDGGGNRGAAVCSMSKVSVVRSDEAAVGVDGT